jgi:hypothetical protein
MGCKARRRIALQAAFRSDKILIAGDARVTITPITGKLGDAIRVTIRMPMEATLTGVALIRLERRTQIGF